MLNKLSKNQYVKMTKPEGRNTGNENAVEYGVVLNGNGENYEIMSVGFENKNGAFLQYPTEVENLVQIYNTRDTNFDEVKENHVRREMDKWMQHNFKM